MWGVLKRLAQTAGGTGILTVRVTDVQSLAVVVGVIDSLATVALVDVIRAPLGVIFFKDCVFNVLLLLNSCGVFSNCTDVLCTSLVGENSTACVPKAAATKAAVWGVLKGFAPAARGTGHFTVRVTDIRSLAVVVGVIGSLATVALVDIVTAIFFGLTAPLSFRDGADKGGARFICWRLSWASSWCIFTESRGFARTHIVGV